MISIILTTVDREKRGSRNYFFDTWNSLVSDGKLYDADKIDNIVISVGEPAGSYSQLIKDHTAIEPVTYNTDLTVVEHTHEAFRIGKELGSQYILIIQDDTLFAVDFMLEAVRFLTECDGRNVADIYTLYTPYREVSEQAGQYWQYKPEQYYSLVCTTFKQSAISDYIDSKYYKDPECYNSPKMVNGRRVWDGADMRIKLFMIDYKKRVAGHCPNIAVHIGSQSSIDHDSNFDKEFRGIDLKKSCLEVSIPTFRRTQHSQIRMRRKSRRRS
jgi:hypothetical protein